MPRFRWIALQGSSRGFLPPLLLFCFITTSGIPAHAADDSTACRPPVARIVSIQGSIELLRARQNDWSKVTRLDTPLCEGDRLRTGVLSRAALFIQPETLVRVDQNTSISVSQTTEETLVEFTQAEVLPAAAGAYSCGAGYFITRIPRKFRVKTPHLNAAVEGTEFLVAMRCESTELSVFEGKVLAAGTADNIFPAQSVVSGQTLTIGGSEPPAIKLHFKPTDAVQWTLYYPPITPAGVVPVEDCRVVAQDNRISCLIARAEQLLRAGRVDEAQIHIGDALAAAPYSSDAKALSSIISLVRNDKAEALRMAKEAVEATANSAPAWLALSYAQQADFKLEAALTSAQRASELTPSSALAFARVAELQLSLGWTREAEKTARQAVADNPSESRAHMILGFVHLAQIKIKEAREDFERAIELDSTEPLSRLGLGLAIIRKGKLVEGREQIEIAVALDSTNSLIRSYVGKAYYEENTKERDELASVQFGLAKRLDPNDPTPWFYDAILKQTQNRPVEALQELQTSIEMNDNRAVYRSRFLLDDDVAARTSSVAAVYNNLGFEKLAILESTKAIAENAGNFSAHQMLATAYTNLPRHDIARVSEALQAQIRRPVSLSSVPLLLSTDNLTILRDAGLTRLATNEYSSLFNSDGASLQFDGISGSRNTLGHQLLASGLADNASVDLSHFRYETEGFIDNDAAEKEIYDFLIRGQPTASSSIQLDLKQSYFKIGETFFRFDPDFSLPVTISEKSKSFRLGGLLGMTADSDWIWTATHEDRYRLAAFYPDGFPITDTDGNAYAAELQNRRTRDNLEIISGIGYVEDEKDFVIEQVVVKSTAGNAYAYGQWRSPERVLSVQAGFAAEWYQRTHTSHANSVQRDVLHPKFGLVWSPLFGSTIRLAAFSSLRRPFVSSQTIEPTQVAGFNQFFSGFEQLYGDVEGTISQRKGIAFDQTLSKTMFAGVELAARRLVVPSINLDQDFIWHESSSYGYLYKTFSSSTTQSPLAGWSAAVSFEGEYEKIDRPPILTGSEGIVWLSTIRLPVGIRIFNAHGISLRLTSTYIKQSGNFTLDEGFPVFEREDAAWITDAAIEYRLPRRLGVVSLVLKNLNDNFIDLVETDPFNPRVATRRFTVVQVKLAL